MNVERFKAADLRPLFKRHGALLKAELKKALGTQVDMTVFRKLKELGYQTSFSHGGRYYTLHELAQFDERGLWSARGAWFSRDGTLLATLERFVGESSAGYFADELREQLHVEVKESLLRLANRGRVHREVVDGRYLYCSMKPATRSRQLRRRHTEASVQRSDTPAAELQADESRFTDEAKAAVLLFISLLDERQRRLYAGLEALRIGAGGDSKIAALLGLHPQTVAKGRRELLEQDVDPDRIRRPGGGRQPVKKKRQR